MKDDLKRLVNEFLDETKGERYIQETIQHTSESKPEKKWILLEPTFQMFIYWLNEKLE